MRFVDADGREHEFVEQMRSSPPRHAAGDAVKLIYRPDRPTAAVIDDFWGRYGLAAIFGGLAVPFTTLGLTLLVVDARRARRRTRLLREGQVIEADFLHVYRDQSLDENGDHPFRVVAQAPDPMTGGMRRFESEPVWVDPTALLKGRRVRVLLDPDRPGDHHIDLSDVVKDSARG